MCVLPLRQWPRPAGSLRSKRPFGARRYRRGSWAYLRRLRERRKNRAPATGRSYGSLGVSFYSAPFGPAHVCQRHAKPRPLLYMTDPWQAPGLRLRELNAPSRYSHIRLRAGYQSAWTLHRNAITV
jgi:hypothetical protein